MTWDVEHAIAELRAAVREGVYGPDTPEGRLIARVGEALRVYDAASDDPGSIPGLPAGDESAVTRMDTRVAGMGGTGLEPVGPDSDIGDGKGTEGPRKATGAGDSDDPDRPLAARKGLDRTPGKGASGSKPGLIEGRS